MNGNITGKYCLYGSLALVIAIHMYILITRGVNWDEFHYYDQVRGLSEGTLNWSLQTIHARLFAWIRHLGGGIVDHVRVARVFMFLCVAGVAVTLFAISRRFASDTSAALVSLAYLSGGYVLIHGTAFRTDPQAALLLMCALWVLSSTRLGVGAILAFGLLAGAAGMVTIKVVFYAPAFAGIAWLRLCENRKEPQLVWRMLACIAASLVAFAVLYAWHSSDVAAPPISAATKPIGEAWRVVFSEGLLPQWRAIVGELLIAPHVAALVVVTLVCWRKITLSRAQKQAMIGLLLPLASFLFYRNSYPYFFVFILPPVLVATAPAIEQILLPRYRVAFLAAIMGALAVPVAWQEPRGVIGGQKQVIDAAHKLFPQRVTYIDFCGYLGDYDRGLPFMPSGWGLSQYRRAGRPEIVELLERKVVPLLIVNHDVLISAVLNRKSGESLLASDAEALRESYIPHWGIIWVAGRIIPQGSLPLTINIRVPGVYTVEGDQITLDGVVRRPGDVVKLERGAHKVGGFRHKQVTLRWGDHLDLPALPPPSAIPYATLR